MNLTTDEQLFPTIFPQSIPMCEFLSFVLKIEPIRERTSSECITDDKIVGKTDDINWNYSE